MQKPGNQVPRESPFSNPTQIGLAQAAMRLAKLRYQDHVLSQALAVSGSRRSKEVCLGFPRQLRGGMDPVRGN